MILLRSTSPKCYCARKVFTSTLRHQQPISRVVQNNHHLNLYLKHNIRAWNRLSIELKLSRSIVTFKRHLKTFLFREAYNCGCLNDNSGMRPRTNYRECSQRTR